jgi:preprotein translocase subunit SecA
MVTRQIKSAQTQIEGQNAEIRKNVLKYDEVLNRQRTVIYTERRRVLNGEDLHDQVTHMIDDVVRAYASGATSEGYAEDWDLDQLWSGLKQLYPVGVTIEGIEEETSAERDQLDTEFLQARMIEDAQEAYVHREEGLGSEAMRELERQVLLAVIDRKWREHLYEMDYLQEGVGLRAYAQRDPLVEYQREGFDMFNQMLEGIKEEAVGFLFNLDVQVEQPGQAPTDDTTGTGTGTGPAPVPLPGSEGPVGIRAKGLGASRNAPRALQYSAPAVDGEAGRGSVMMEQAPALGLGSGSGSDDDRPVRRPGPSSATATGARGPSAGQAVGSSPSRNAPCPCGSGKKYKRCHGAPAV